MEKTLEKAMLGGGCFWCLEAVYRRVKGVGKVQSGYSGGTIKNPAYREVCNGTTGHAEVCEIEFNPEIISFQEILNIFWKIHDPTTLNRQGNDIGTQYRSVIFFHNPRQQTLAEESKNNLSKRNYYSTPIMTEISPCKNFYPAESDHNSYYDLHPGESYCRFVILPKIEKFKTTFIDKIKKAED